MVHQSAIFDDLVMMMEASIVLWLTRRDPLEDYSQHRDLVLKYFLVLILQMWNLEGENGRLRLGFVGVRWIVCEFDEV